MNNILNEMEMKIKLPPSVNNYARKFKILNNTEIMPEKVLSNMCHFFTLTSRKVTIELFVVHFNEQESGYSTIFYRKFRQSKHSIF